MTTFNKGTGTSRPERTRTFEGGEAVVPSALVNLAFTAACTFIGQDTFYETGDERMQRILLLTREAGKTHPDEVVDLIRTIRREYKIRAAAIVIAVEFVSFFPSHRTREAVANACWRADEPGEFLAHWMQRFGKRIPRGVKLGLGDAVHKLYIEHNAMKWDSKDRAVRMGDVLELCHIKPENTEQATLYRYLLDVRHRGNEAWAIDSNAENEQRTVDPGHFRFDRDALPAHLNRRVLNDIPESDRRQALRTWGMNFLTASGLTWEQLSSWLPGGMDAEAWQFAIPNMQVMALIRNLRNFDKAGLPEQWVDRVIDKITSPEDVLASRVFPYQVLTAYRFAESDNWKRALGKTLEHASGNVPSLPRSLFVIDTSSSMRQPVSERSKISSIEVAALQAVSVAKQSPDSDIVIYGNSNRRLRADEWRAKSVLGATEYICGLVGSVGHATYGHTAIRDNFDPSRHDRAVMFTDDQQHDSGTGYYSRTNVDISHVPQLITFNIGGYAPKSTWGKVGAQTNVQVAGYSDQVFQAVADLLT